MHPGVAAVCCCLLQLRVAQVLGLPSQGACGVRWPGVYTGVNRGSGVWGVCTTHCVVPGTATGRPWTHRQGELPLSPSPRQLPCPSLANQPRPEDISLWWWLLNVLGGATASSSSAAELLQQTPLCKVCKPCLQCACLCLAAAWGPHCFVAFVI